MNDGPVDPRNTRAIERYVLHPPAVATTDGAGEVAVLDISISGTRIRHRRPLDAGVRLLMKARLDDRSIAMTLSGSVVWTRAEMVGSEPTWLSGIAFDTNMDALRPVIQHLFISRGLELLESRYS